MQRRQSLPFVFLLPTMAILLLLALVPTFYAINISLQDRTLSNPTAGYVGFLNYIDDVRRPAVPECPLGIS